MSVVTNLDQYLQSIQDKVGHLRQRLDTLQRRRDEKRDAVAEYVKLDTNQPFSIGSTISTIPQNCVLCKVIEPSQFRNNAWTVRPILADPAQVIDFGEVELDETIIITEVFILNVVPGDIVLVFCTNQRNSLGQFIVNFVGISIFSHSRIEIATILTLFPEYGGITPPGTELRENLYHCNARIDDTGEVVPVTFLFSGRHIPDSDDPYFPDYVPMVRVDNKILIAYVGEVKFKPGDSLMYPWVAINLFTYFVRCSPDA